MYNLKCICKDKNSKELKKLSHLGVSGEIDYICFPRSKEEIFEAFSFAIQKNLSPYPLGGGSNTLIGDVRSYLIISDLKLKKTWIQEDNLITVSPNWNINSLLLTAAKEGLYGLEFLAGIPAHLGGIAYMNAGAYGKEISEYIEYVEVLNSQGETSLISLSDTVYRDSKVTGFIFEMCIKLNKIKEGEIKNQILNNIQNYIVKRKQTQPLDSPNLGCFFKNPLIINEKGVAQRISAGKLIEQAGLKGFQVGGAMVSKLHGNFLVNKGNAVFNDFISLISIIKEKVYERFNIELELEVKILNG